MFNLPSVSLVRKRIERVSITPVKYYLQCAYLFCARSCEVAGMSHPSDVTSTPWGPHGTDVRIMEYKADGAKELAAVFTVKTAKRDGRERHVALPLNPDYEPWTKGITQYFERRGEAEVFPFSRQYVHKVITREGTFDSLSYPIESYSWKKDGRVVKEVAMHARKFKLHALRHLRATELVDFYGFSLEELATYGGWTLKSVAIGSSAMSRYLALNWQGYFGKLLRAQRIPMSSTLGNDPPQRSIMPG